MGVNNLSRINLDPISIALGDLCSVYANPARAAHGLESSYTHVKHLADSNIDDLAIYYPWEKLGTFGLNIAALYNANPLESFDESGNSLGQIDFGELQAGISYGTKLNDVIALGGKAAFIREQMDKDSAYGWSFLGGCLGKIKALTWGGILGFGYMSAYADTTPANMEFQARGGAAYRFELAGDEQILTPSAELAFSASEGFSLHAGIEYVLFKTMAVRCGYFQRFNEGNEPLNQLSFGMGFTLPRSILNTTLELNYAFRPLAPGLSTGHTIQLVWRM